MASGTVVGAGTPWTGVPVGAAAGVAVTPVSNKPEGGVAAGVATGVATGLLPVTGGLATAGEEAGVNSGVPTGVAWVGD